MMTTFWFLVCLLLTPATARVCIVGAGIGGVSTAHFLRDLDPDMAITVFERSAQVGGRIQSLRLNRPKLTVEVGAAVFHDNNHYVVSFARELGLTIQSAAAKSYGIYDGWRFVYEAVGVKSVDLGRLFLRYGVSLLKVQSLANQMRQRYTRIYDLQSKGRTFASPQELLEELGLYELTQMSLVEMLEAHDINRKLIDEIITGATRIVYGQDVTLTALTGILSIAGILSNIKTVANGYQQVPEGLIRRSNVDLMLNTTVESIDVQEDEMVLMGSPDFSISCKAVVIAAPLGNASIRLPSSFPSVPNVKYHHTQTTYIRGRIRPSAFGRTGKVPCSIYTTENPRNDFISIDCYNVKRCSILPKWVWYPGSKFTKKTVYKVYSRLPLTDTWIEERFEDAEVITSVSWKAYPEFKPGEKFGPFVLAPGVVYINSIEPCLSATEISAVGAKNAALLVYKWLRERHQKMDALMEVSRCDSYVP